jgi:arylsulfatase A-like enzyme
MTDVIYLTVDSLRADHVGWHGYDRDTTPFLDELADNAHEFINAYTHGCFTRQAFPSMMASEYPSICRTDGGLSEEFETIAQAFSTGGYTTGGFHSNPHLLPKFNYHRGFDRFYDSNTEPSKLARLRQLVKDKVPSQSFVYKIFQTVFNKTEETVGFNPGTPFVLADEITDEAITWVKSVADEDQRFLWLHYMDVHHPYSPPEEHQRAFLNQPISDRRAVQLRRKMLDSPEDITEQEFNDIVALYDAEIRFVDAEIQRLVESIKAHWGSDVVIAFTSDHGEELKDRGTFSHGATLFDELIHVPLIIKHGDKSEIHEEVVGLMDLPPTLVECADVTIPSSFRGNSLKSLIEGGEIEKDYIIADQGDTIAYRDSTWKYITGPDRSELYNVSEDPGETTNVIESNSDIIPEIENTLAEYPQLGKKSEVELNKENLSGEVQDRLEQLGYLQE